MFSVIRKHSSSPTKPFFPVWLKFCCMTLCLVASFPTSSHFLLLTLASLPADQLVWYSAHSTKTAISMDHRWMFRRQTRKKKTTVYTESTVHCKSTNSFVCHCLVQRFGLYLQTPPLSNQLFFIRWNTKQSWTVI